MDQGVINESKA